tara:strand:+ start:4206 stop:5990 length:1785 start_codon:yes stop_codon:yes gene_type:complete
MFTVFLFAGCGGGSSDGPTLTPQGGGGSTTDGTDTTTGEVVTQRTVRFGSFSGGVFTGGQIAANTMELDAGQSATLSVSFIDQNNTLVADATDILFNSTCIGNGLAEINPAIATNTSGTVTATYTARGCNGADEIKAQTSLDGTSYSAKITITSTPAPLGSIQFVSATPTIIGIKGSGAIPEQSVVSYRVTNSSGGPVQNQEVEFSLNNTTGGITISNTIDISDNDGLVSTTVASGTIATSVRVTAKAEQGTISSSAQSSALVITTGIPDQDSFSLSASDLNIEGLERDNIQATLNILAADRFNNPVPDGTAIAFRAEGGVVEGSCTTTGGGCSVIFKSSNPRPSDGRVTILATAVGEESFQDTTPSNGSYDDTETFTDLPEAFVDYDEDGCRDNFEPWVDFNDPTTFNGTTEDLNLDGFCSFGIPNEIIGNTNYDGIRCVDSAGGCQINASSLNVRDDIVIVFAGSTLNIDIDEVASGFILPENNEEIILNVDDDITDTITLDTAITNILVTVWTKYPSSRQLPPSGTKISVTASQGSIEGTNSITVPSSNTAGPYRYLFKLTKSNDPGEGTFGVSVTTPKGIQSQNNTSVIQ